MSDEEIMKNFKIVNDRINEIHKRLDDMDNANKSMLEDAIIELASLIPIGEE